MSRLTDMILNGVENGEHTGMILIDLQKTLDTWDNKILLRKMKGIDFLDKAMKRFQPYLANRAFFFSLENLLPEA